MSNGTIKAAPVPRFAGMAQPSYDFDSLVDGIRCTPFVYELDLATARDFAAGTAVQVKITGNCCLIDTAPDVGMARVVFEGVQDYTAGQVRAPIYCRPGFVTRIPFCNLYIANHAQPGKKLRLIYGVDIDFQELAPALIDARPAPLDYTGYYSVIGATVANTAYTVVAPSTNVNGVILQSANIMSESGYRAGFIAKATPPATVVDGEPILTLNGAVSGNFRTAVLPHPVLLRPGLGLYRIASAAELDSHWSCLFTVL